MAQARDEELMRFKLGYRRLGLPFFSFFSCSKRYGNRRPFRGAATACGVLPYFEQRKELR